MKLEALYKLIKLDSNRARDQLITIALARTDGDRTQAAKMLGIPLRSFNRIIKIRIENDD